MKDNTQDHHIVMPEIYTRRKLNAMYREIPLKDTTSRLLRKYFNAFANLYGIVPLRKAWEIISNQNPTLVSKKEFFAFVEIARHECEGYCILKESELYLDGKPTGRLDWRIVKVMLLYDESDALYHLEMYQDGKDYFIPPKTELLRYRDVSYCEPTPQANRMREFLSETLCLQESKAKIVFDVMVLYERCLRDELQEVVEIVEEAGAVFNEKTLRAFAAVYQDFHNHIRIPHNRGYTPHELFSMKKPEDRIPKAISFGSNIRNALADGSMDAEKMRKDILEMDVPDDQFRNTMLKALDEAEAAGRAPKVGRNDPCPCGSGKKYKKCCGR